jgi:hypothetical protein
MSCHFNLRLRTAALTMTVTVMLGVAACSGSELPNGAIGATQADGGTSAGGEGGGTTAGGTDVPESPNGTEPTRPPAGVIADGDGLGVGWNDFGWAATIPDTGPVQVNIGAWGGWIAAHPDLTGTYKSLLIELDAPESLGEHFLRVQLGDDIGSAMPTIEPTFSGPADKRTAEIPTNELLGGLSSFDRIVLQAADEYDDPTMITVLRLELIVGEPPAKTPESIDDASARVDCVAAPTPISPHVYGTARPIPSAIEGQWSLHPASRRWGGNPTTRYNWRLGAWNTSNDYYFENVDVSADDGTPAHEVFLEENWAHEVASAITIPMLGWVAKDTTSYSFPVSRFGEQQYVDGSRPDAGNGVDPDGNPIEAGDPSATSVPSTPDDVTAWIRSMNELADAAGRPRPMMYFLDNEPMLWHLTHRDVRSEPLGYDELLQRTIDYATAIRKADPDALIAGPSVWGWPAYFYSAIDADAGFSVKPDRRAHGGTPLIEWYLEQLQAYEQRTGVRLLDVLDVHFYPQDGSYGNDVDDTTVARRIRSTRSLWDPNYGEESWIEDTVELLPRMQKWVDEHYPGTKLSIGEYSFGGERHMSGGLAEAEALGRFGQANLFSAYYWDVPEPNSPAYWAFRAYRDYDGVGSQFGDLSRPTDAERPMSLFASTTTGGDRDVLVVLNSSPDHQLDTTIDIAGCRRSSAAVYQYAGAPTGFVSGSATVADEQVRISLAPFSITVIALT